MLALRLVFMFEVVFVLPAGPAHPGKTRTATASKRAAIMPLADPKYEFRDELLIYSS
jgi:hypothetical protein